MKTLKIALVGLVLSLPVLSLPILSMPAHADITLEYIELAVSQADAAKKWYTLHLPCEAVADKDEQLLCGGMTFQLVARQSLGGSQGTSVNHISFSYPDVVAKMGSLEDVGVGGAGVRLQRFDDGSLTREDDGVVHGYIFDPWGTRIELVQREGEPSFDHVHLHSANTEEAIQWYVDSLGAQTNATGFTLGEASFHVSTNAEGRPAGTTERAVDHLGLVATNLESLSAALAASGLQMRAPEKPENGRTAAKRALLTGPDGVRIAIVEPGWGGIDQVESTQELAAAAPSEPFTVPRTPWGEPDFQGMWTGNAAHGIPLERPEDLAGETLTADQAAERREQGTLRSIWGYEREWRDTTLGYDRFAASRQVAMIIDPPDGRLPALTPAGEKALEDAAAHRASQFRAAGPEVLSSWVRCITQGLPTLMMPGVYNNGLQIQQSPGYFAINKEMIHETRVIPTTPKPRSGIKQWLGSSRGKWEGDTLVVEVTDFNGASLYRGAGENLKITERYTLIDADTLEYQFTMDDPTIWTEPWTGMFHFKRDEAQYELVEYACHEGNYGMQNILSAARAKDREAAADASGD